jgi:thioredoxin-dependent peroxiredoxin
MADADRQASNLYRMVHPEAGASITVRRVFIVDPRKNMRPTLTYPTSTGHNFACDLRSLQLTGAHKEATPVNSTKGHPVIVPALSDADAKARFPRDWKTLKP